MEEYDILSYEFLKVDLSRRQFYLNDINIFLRNMEFCLLVYFMQNIGKVLSRTTLLEEVWDRNICCATNTVDVHVSKLRQKLKKNSNVDFIRTVHCIGYIFEI